MRIAVDTGGTFTDLVLENNTSLQMFKTSTTPKDPIEGILNAVDMAAKGNNLSIEQLLAKTDTFIHGTTHAINAVITGNVAKTAFLTTKGHPDVLVWREGGRIEPFDYTVPSPQIQPRHAPRLGGSAVRVPPVTCRGPKGRRRDLAGGRSGPAAAARGLPEPTLPLSPSRSRCAGRDSLGLSVPGAARGPARWGARAPASVGAARPG